MFILLILIYVLIVTIRIIQPVHTRLGRFGLKQRAEDGDKSAAKILEREQLLPLIIILRNFLILIFGSLFLAVAITKYSLWTGILLTMFMVISIVPLARIKALSNLIMPHYQKREAKILKFVAKLAVVLKFFRTVSTELATKNVESKEELMHIIATANAEIITEDEKKIITAALQFSDGVVADIMTPVDKIIFVENREVLGPVVLDKLGRTGFQRFPVFDKDPNHI
ncbi:MAG: hypothetical protein LBE03_00225, partial [Candidatus Nomurabacteria bacterium]|nr:hypothetical protein [Candidatus Nomurabacteria bacterium]